MKTSLQIRIDPKTKEELRASATEIGISMSSLMNATIKQMLRDQRRRRSENAKH